MNVIHANRTIAYPPMLSTFSASCSDEEHPGYASWVRPGGQAFPLALPGGGRSPVQVDHRNTETGAVVVEESRLFSGLNSLGAVWFYLAAGWLLGLPLGVPTSLTHFDPSWDPSWQFGLAYAAERGVVHGRDLAFNVGPLGHLLHPVLIGTAASPGLHGRKFPTSRRLPRRSSRPTCE